MQQTGHVHMYISNTLVIYLILWPVAVIYNNAVVAPDDLWITSKMLMGDVADNSSELLSSEQIKGAASPCGHLVGRQQRLSQLARAPAMTTHCYQAVTVGHNHLPNYKFAHPNCHSSHCHWLAWCQSELQPGRFPTHTHGMQQPSW